jgi:predicted RNase H-like HicB family nuclease
MKYSLVLKKQSEGGYTAQCLELPGAISQGQTKAEAVKNVREAAGLLAKEIRTEAKAQLTRSSSRPA